MSWFSFIGDYRFYLILLALGTIGYGLVAKTGLKRLPIFSKKKTLIAIGAIGFVITSGVFSSVIGTASLTGAPAVSAVSISDLQVTTAFNSTVPSNSPAPAESSSVHDLIDMRMEDSNVSETAGCFELDAGIITVTRSGDLSAASCPVVCSVPPSYGDEAGDDGRRYNILEKTALGEWECYLQNGAVATASSPKGKTHLSFAEGVATATLGVVLEIDEEGHDALNQYSYKDVSVSVCGKPYTFRVHRTD